MCRVSQRYDSKLKAAEQLIVDLKKLRKGTKPDPEQGTPALIVPGEIVLRADPELLRFLFSKEKEHWFSTVEHNECFFSLSFKFTRNSLEYNLGIRDQTYVYSWPP